MKLGQTLTRNLCDGVVFDLDGTLINSLPIHHEAFLRALKPYGVEPDPKEIIGLDTQKAIRYLTAELNLNEREIESLVRTKRSIASELFERREDLLMPGALGLIQYLQEKYVLAICSSGSRRTLEVAARSGLDLGCFKAIVTAEDVTTQKPDPAPYRAVSGRLGIAANRLIAVEDSSAGAKSAHDAGLRVILVGQEHIFGKLDFATQYQPSLASLLGCFE